MKKQIISLATFLLMGMHLLAQGVLTLSGVVTDNTGAPVGGQQVCVQTDSTYSGPFTFYDCATTDSFGFYQIFITGGSNIGPNIVFNAYTYGCGGYYAQTFSNMQGTVDQQTVDFNLGCQPNSPSCDASFTFSPTSAAFTYQFQAAIPANTFQASWSFGDGTTSSDLYPLHTFPDSGVYNVCLTIFDNAGCQDTECNSVVLTDSSNSGGCQASFSISNSPSGAYVFNQTVVNSTVGATFNWSFSTGESLSGPTVSTNFDNTNLQNGDTVQVCLNVYIAGTNCNSTVCQYFLFNNGGGNPTGNCSALFQVIDSAGYTYLIPNQLNNAASYSWSLSTGQVSNDIMPVFQLPSGQTTICLDVFSLLDSCQDSYCQIVYINDSTNNGGCSAAFNVFNPSPNSTDFVFVPNQNASTYFWDFGDGNTSTDASPTHAYNAQGTFGVCLTIVNANGCTDTQCDTITVGNSGGLYLSGFVYNGNLPAYPAEVRIIKWEQTTAGVLLTSVAVTNTDSMGGYYFYDVVPANYLIKANLTPNSPLYSQYLPTYYGDVLFWNQASQIGNSSSGVGYQINLIQGNNPGGPGFVGGLVSQGANKTQGPGDPMPGELVMLLNMNNTPLQYALTDDNGAFSFSNIALGTYKVYTEVLGLPTEPVIVNLTEETPSFDEVLVFVNSDGVVAGIVSEEKTQLITFYPNPTQGELTVNSEKIKISSVEVFNLLGVKLLATTNIENGISLEAFPRGTYLIKVQTEQGNVSIKRILKN